MCSITTPAVDASWVWVCACVCFMRACELRMPPLIPLTSWLLLPQHVSWSRNVNTYRELVTRPVIFCTAVTVGSFGIASWLHSADRVARCVYCHRTSTHVLSPVYV
jgi:hypothetical protein